MSPTEPQPTTAQKIETIYTTVESEPDRTDWLTAVSNLRQINRQLVEEIARLEQALATTKQALHSHKEQNQSHEITIMQQQDELRIAHDRLGGLFQQLETSHQIGQRQQTLVETLSQQLEIVQTIVPQLEAEHDKLADKYHQQSQKLIRTEQIAVQLHRRLQHKPLENDRTETAVDEDTIPEIEDNSAEIDLVIASILAAETVTSDEDHLLSQPAQTEDLAESNILQKNDPVTPKSLLQSPHREIPRWIPSPPKVPAKTISIPSQPSSLRSWREEIANQNVQNLHRTNLDIPSLIPPSVEVTDKESTTVKDALPNWPAPTLNLDPTTAKQTKIDLPKFPKK